MEVILYHKIKDSYLRIAQMELDDSAHSYEVLNKLNEMTHQTKVTDGSWINVDDTLYVMNVNNNFIVWPRPTQVGDQALIFKGDVTQLWQLEPYGWNRVFERHLSQEKVA